MKMKSVQMLHHTGKRGIMLIDCMVYLAVFFAILAVSFKLFYSCWDSSKHLRRNTDQIAATLKAGERWRADVRKAVAMPHAEASNDGTILRIPQKSGEVDYRFAQETLWRRNGRASEWISVLPNVKSSLMEPDRRDHVAAWRWEVELVTKRKGAKVVPLFTFEAVPQPKY